MNNFYDRSGEGQDGAPREWGRGQMQTQPVGPPQALTDVGPATSPPGGYQGYQGPQNGGVVMPPNGPLSSGGGSQFGVGFMPHGGSGGSPFGGGLMPPASRYQQWSGGWGQPPLGPGGSSPYGGGPARPQGGGLSMSRPSSPYQGMPFLPMAWGGSPYGGPTTQNPMQNSGRSGISPATMSQSTGGYSGSLGALRGSFAWPPR